jgi:hypothetical protein
MKLTRKKAAEAQLNKALASALDTELAAETFGPIEDYAPISDTERVKQHIAGEALRITSGARRAAYGPPEMNFERIARFWQAYFQNTGRDIAVTAADVSPMMRFLKEARLCETPNHADSFVDLVGYALTGSEVNGVKIDR